MEEETSLLRQSTHQESRPLTNLRRILAYILPLTLLASLLINIQLAIALVSASSPLNEFAWSPILSDIPARLVRYNNTYHYDPKHHSPFDGNSTAADAHWNRFVNASYINGLTGTIALSESVLKKHFAHQYGPEWLDSAIEVPNPDAGGEKMYMANLDLFHLMHCLSFFRSAIYNGTEMMQNPNYVGHQEHCLRSVREAIMCNAGNGITVYHWMKDQVRPYPGYNTYHMCRDPEEVLEWAGKKSVPIKGWMRKPKGTQGWSDPFEWGAAT